MWKRLGRRVQLCQTASLCVAFARARFTTPCLCFNKWRAERSLERVGETNRKCSGVFFLFISPVSGAAKAREGRCWRYCYRSGFPNCLFCFGKWLVSNLSLEAGFAWFAVSGPTNTVCCGAALRAICAFAMSCSHIKLQQSLNLRVPVSHAIWPSHTQKAHPYVHWKVCQPREGWKELLIHRGMYLYEISSFKFFPFEVFYFPPNTGRVKEIESNESVSYHYVQLLTD